MTVRHLFVLLIKDDFNSYSNFMRGFKQYTKPGNMFTAVIFVT